MNDASSVSSEARQWAMICHLSGLILGFGVGPLIVWLLKKNEHGFVDEQGKEALNFQITMLLAAFAGVILALVLVGFLILPAVGVMMVVFPIIAGIKANEGVHYRYPLTLRLIK